MTDVDLYLASRPCVIDADATDGSVKMMADFLALDAQRQGYEVSRAEMRTALKAQRKRLRKQQAKQFLAA